MVRTSLVVQGLRLALPMQAARGSNPYQELDPTCCNQDPIESRGTPRSISALERNPEVLASTPDEDLGLGTD